jgi:beta-glucosidase
VKGFDVVRLEPGEARNVKINVPLDDLAIFDERSGSRVVPPGLYEIQLGASSAELLAKAELQIGSGRSQQADGAR